ncbi:MAG: serine hydrolase domain-containing protein [Planctomycetaceae bacterium]
MRLIPMLTFLLVLASTAQAADETVERKGLSATELSAYVDQLTSQGQIISDLRVRVVERKAVFDVTAEPNRDKRAWLIQVNISDKEFRDAKKRYSDDGFKNTIHRASERSGELHSTIWVQKTENIELLKLPAGSVPVTGELGKNLEPINELLLKTLMDNNIPGATLAVARDGIIVYERGFGYSDLEQQTRMAANTTLRIASISKPITAVAVLLLVDDGKLKLDDYVIDYLVRDKKFALPKDADPAWSRVTIRHLLQHSGGWNRDKSKDPMFELLAISRAMELKQLARIPDIVRYQLSRSLDFEPGTEHQYSNFGYCLLGRVIEAASGQPYASFVTERILKPAGMLGTRLGKTRLADRADDEAHYYTQTLKTYPAIWDAAHAGKSGKFELVQAPYGQSDLEVMDSHGAWTSTASDLVRFAAAMDSGTKPLLKPDTLRQLRERPAFAGSDADTWYGLGWNVRSIKGLDRVSMWHTGQLAGTSTILVKRWDNFVWAVLFNVDETKDGNKCATLIHGPIHMAVDGSLAFMEPGE